MPRYRTVGGYPNPDPYEGEDGDHELGRKLTEAGISWFVCPFCSVINVLAADVLHRYCGRCHRFGDDAQGHFEE